MVHWLKVHPTGLVLSAVAYILIGFLFYSRWGLGKFWPELGKHVLYDANKSKAKSYFGAFIAALLLAFVMGSFINLVHVRNMMAGLLIAFLAWLGFILPTLFSRFLFTKKPFQLFCLDAFYYLVTFLVTGALMGHFARFLRK